MKKVFLGVFYVIVFAVAYYAFKGCGKDTSLDNDAFDREEDIKTEIVFQYSQQYKDFKLGSMDALCKTIDGYEGTIKFTYNDNGTKMVGVQNFSADNNGKITEITFESSVSYNDLQPGVIPEIK